MNYFTSEYYIWNIDTYAVVYINFPCPLLLVIVYILCAASVPGFQLELSFEPGRPSAFIPRCEKLGLTITLSPSLNLLSTYNCTKSLGVRLGIALLLDNFGERFP